MERQADGSVAGVLVLVLGAYTVFVFVSGGGEDPASIADVPEADGSSTTQAFGGDFDGT